MPDLNLLAILAAAIVAFVIGFSYYAVFGERLVDVSDAEVAARRAGFDSIYLYTHERMTENLALYSRIGYVEYDRRGHGEARLVYLRKKLG